MNYLVISSILLFILGLAHSAMGEWLIFRKKREPGHIVPTLSGADLRQRHLRIIWATWHFASVLGWCVSFILWFLSAQPSVLSTIVGVYVVRAIAISCLFGSLLVAIGTREKHPGWVVLLIAGLLLIIHPA